MHSNAKGWRWHPRDLLREENTGLLLDVTVLVANLIVMDPLARLFVSLVRRADGGDAGANTLLAAFAVALFVLQPAGAVLKRWHFHRRHARAAGLDPLEGAGGCLFNPIFHFCLQTVVFCTVAAFLFQNLDLSEDASAPVFLTVIFAGIVLIVANTTLVYRYFSPPARPPRYAWMRRPGSERVGDAFLFANMLAYQVFWNLVGQMEISRVSGVAEFVGRLGLLTFLALLLYFPPRMLYLAEDLHRTRTWVWIFVANAPVIWRALVGTGG